MLDKDNDLIEKSLKSPEDKKIYWEKNNCTIRAFAIAQGLTFSEAKEALKGIKEERKGICFFQWTAFLNEHNYKRSNVRFLTFALLQKMGILDKNKTYILNKKGHTFAIKNGKASEKVHGKTLIRSFYEKTYPIVIYKERA